MKAIWISLCAIVAAPALARASTDGAESVRVVLRRPPTAPERSALARSGLELRVAINARTFIARARGSALGHLAVESWRPIRPEDRRAPGLRTDGDHIRNTTVVMLPPSSASELANLLWNDGADVHGAFDALGLVFVAMDGRMLRRMLAHDDVLWIEPGLGRAAPETNRGRAFVNASPLPAPPYTLTGTGVEVSVHDFGHAFSHDDLAGRVLQGDAASGQPLTIEVHPTMCAGTIAGDGTINAAYRGMAPNATIASFSFEGYSGTPCCDVTISEDVLAVMQRGTSIANNSWGFPGCATVPYGAYTALARTFDQHVLGFDQNMLPIGPPTTVIFSAGNERIGVGGNPADSSCIADAAPPYANYGTLNNPKAAKNVLVVGAIDSADDRMSTFSGWGPTGDGRLKPELVAGGVHGGADQAGVSHIDNCFGSPVGAQNQQCYRAPHVSNTQFGGYAWFSQTSAAAAIASGAAALFVEDHRSRFGEPSPASVRAHFAHTARDLDDGTSWYNRGPDFASGYGVLDVEAAIVQLRANASATGCVDTQDVNEYFLSVSSPDALVKVTLAWDDVPGVPTSSGAALINDLDLVVLDPNGTRHFPWTLNPLAPSETATRSQADTRNNLEQVLVDGAVDGPIATGQWSIRVEGSAIPMGPQCYALAFSTPSADADGDGIPSIRDCDDTDPTVFPGAPDICDGVNNDCEHPDWPSLAGTRDADDDGDGLSECSADCDDDDADTYPGAPQICDDANNDCDDLDWPTCLGGECADFCDDGDACTLGDTCVGTVCTSTGTLDCSDGNLCNGDEVCLDGVCEGGTILDCDDRDPCTADSCDPGLGCQNAGSCAPDVGVMTDAGDVGPTPDGGADVGSRRDTGSTTDASRSDRDAVIPPEQGCGCGTVPAKRTSPPWGIALALLLLQRWRARAAPGARRQTRAWPLGR